MEENGRFEASLDGRGRTGDLTAAQRQALSLAVTSQPFIDEIRLSAKRPPTADAGEHLWVPLAPGLMLQSGRFLLWGDEPSPLRPVRDFLDALVKGNEPSLAALGTGPPARLDEPLDVGWIAFTRAPCAPASCRRSISVRLFEQTASISHQVGAARVERSIDRAEFAALLDRHLTSAALTELLAAQPCPAQSAGQTLVMEPAPGLRLDVPHAGCAGPATTALIAALEAFADDRAPVP